MRFTPVGLALLILVGCAGAEPGPRSPVAWVGPDTLEVQRLAEIFVLAQPMELTPAQAELWVHQWLEATILAAAAARDQDALGRALQEAVMGVELQEAVILEYVAQVSEAVPTLTDQRVDSIFRAGELRLVGHVFRRAGPGSSPGAREGQRGVAERLQRLLAETGQLSAVNLENEDDVAREQGGVRLVVPGDLPPEADAAAYALAPGQLSALVESDFGFHIVFRPHLDLVRPTFQRMVEDFLREEARIDYLDAREGELELELVAEDPERIRVLLRDPYAFVESDLPLARYAGTELVASDLARFVLGFPAGAMDGLLEGGIEELEELVRHLAARQRLEREARESGLVDVDRIRRELEEEYQREIEELWRHARIRPDSLAAEEPRPPAREELARWRVDQYMEAVASRRAPPASLPPPLAAHLLSRAEWGVDREAIENALAIAARLLAAAGYEGPGDLPGLAPGALE